MLFLRVLDTIFQKRARIDLLSMVSSQIMPSDQQAVGNLKERILALINLYERDPYVSWI